MGLKLNYALGGIELKFGRNRTIMGLKQNLLPEIKSGSSKSQSNHYGIETSRTRYSNPFPLLSQSNHYGIETFLVTATEIFIEASQSNHYGIETNPFRKLTFKALSSQSNHYGIETLKCQIFSHKILRSQSNHYGIETLSRYFTQYVKQCRNRTIMGLKPLTLLR